MLNIPLHAAQSQGFPLPIGHESHFYTRGTPLDLNPTALWQELRASRGILSSSCFLLPCCYATGQPGLGVMHLDWVCEKGGPDLSVLFVFLSGLVDSGNTHPTIMNVILLLILTVYRICVFLATLFFLFFWSSPQKEGSSHRVLLFFCLFLWFARALCFDKLRLVSYM